MQVDTDETFGHGFRSIPGFPEISSRTVDVIVVMEEKIKWKPSL